MSECRTTQGAAEGGNPEEESREHLRPSQGEAGGFGAAGFRDASGNDKSRGDWTSSASARTSEFALAPFDA